MKRVDIISKEEDKIIEQDNVKIAFRACGYPEWVVNKDQSQKKKREKEKDMIDRELTFDTYVRTIFKKASQKLTAIFRSVTYGLNCITNTCIYSWNNLTKTLEKPSTLSITMLKKKMFNHCIANY